MELWLVPLSFEQSDEMEQSASGLGLEDGGAHGPSMNMAHWGKGTAMVYRF